MQYLPVALPAEHSLSYVYLNDFANVAEFFTYDPRDSLAFIKRQQYLAQTGYARQNLADVLIRYNQVLGAGALTLKNAASLANNSTLAVITGQQAGILTGPLLTIYKTVTAILLAKKTEAQLGIKVVPVFWVAGEDHDYLEINHVHFLGEKRRHKTVYLPYKPQGSPAVNDILTGDYCDKFLRECFTGFESGEFTEQLHDLLRSTLTKAGNLADWFTAIMLDLFQEYGLVCLNPMLSELRKILVPFYHDVVDQVYPLNQLLLENRQRLERQGFCPAVNKVSRHSHLFVFNQNYRMPLLADGERFTAGNLTLTRQEIDHLIDNNPELFSPDVILRPVAQELLLPTLAYVAGPGEINYWGQLKRIFEHFRLKMPIVFPRLSLTLVEPETQRFLERAAVNDYSMVWNGLTAQQERILKSLDPLGIEAVFSQGRKELGNIYQDLKMRLKMLGNAFQGNCEKTYQQNLRKLNYLETKAWQKHRRQHQKLIQQFNGTRQQLYPKQKSQESVYNIFSYYPRYGQSLLDSLFKTDLIQDFNHKFLFIGENDNV